MCRAEHLSLNLLHKHSGFPTTFLHFDKIAILTKRPAIVIIKDGKNIFAVEQQQGGQNGLFG